jgi:hypothetical protein
MNDRLSIIVIMGYVGQESLDPDVADEIACLRRLPEADIPLEVVIADRAWPVRWCRIREELGDMLDRVRYVPVRPSEWVRRGMYVVSGAMNSGAICSSGSLLLMSGDHSLYDPRQLEMMYTAWFNSEILYAPVVDFSWGEYQLPKTIEPVQGLNVGPRLLTREMLRQIGGWEEAFDGSRGRDDEGIDLCLEVLLKKEYDLERLRHPDLIIHKVPHKNGHLPFKYDPPWTEPMTPDRVRARCNLAFAQKIVYPRYEARQYRANLPVGRGELSRLRESCDISILHHAPHVPRSTLLQANQHICACRRPDREQQLESYTKEQLPNVAALMDSFEEEFGTQYGCFDPWLILAGRRGQAYNFAKRLQDGLADAPPILAHTAVGHTTKEQP